MTAPKGDTPKEVIDKLNSLFTEWKTTKQIKYDKDGNRIDR